ncbi:uncharacterized protein ACNS7B_006225 isoform 2-T2 [Menidia menidia]
MVDRSIALEALGALLNAEVTSSQEQSSQSASSESDSSGGSQSSQQWSLPSAPPSSQRSSQQWSQESSPPLSPPSSQRSSQQWSQESSPPLSPPSSQRSSQQWSQESSPPLSPPSSQRSSQQWSQESSPPLSPPSSQRSSQQWSQESSPPLSPPSSQRSSQQWSLPSAPPSSQRSSQQWSQESSQQWLQLSIEEFVSSVLNADETRPTSREHFQQLQHALQGDGTGAGVVGPNLHDTSSPPLLAIHIIDEDEFFDQTYDHDFTKLRDTETYCRGGEVYERPCGWYRFGLKVLNKYDGNEWLGNCYRTTQLVPGEWPVSYHGTSKRGAEGIIKGFYQPGDGDRFGRGIYSTPYIDVAERYTSEFISKKDRKKYKVILQNRINPKYRRTYNNEEYWLIPIESGLSHYEEEEMVKRAIRPYGLLVKKV